MLLGTGRSFRGMPFIFKGMHKLSASNLLTQFFSIGIFIFLNWPSFSLRIVTQESQPWSTMCPQECSLNITLDKSQVSSLESLCPLGPRGPCSPACGSSSLIPAISYLPWPHFHPHTPGSPWPALVLGQEITPSLFKEGEMCLCLTSMHSARRSTSCLSYCYL